MNIMSTQTLTLARPQRLTLVASNNSRSSGSNIVTLPVAPGVIFTQLPLEAFVPIPGLESRIEKLIQAALDYETSSRRKLMANAANRRMSKKVGGAASASGAAPGGAPGGDSDDLYRACRVVFEGPTAYNFDNASTNAALDAVIAYLAKVMVERFTAGVVPPKPTGNGPPPPSTVAKEQALHVSWVVANYAHTSAISQNAILADGHRHMEAMIAELRKMKAAIRQNANGTAGAEQNRRIKAATIVAFTSVSRESSEDDAGKVVKNLAELLSDPESSFNLTKAQALRAAATLLAPTTPAPGEAAAAAARPPLGACLPADSLLGATARAAPSGGAAGFAQTPLVGGGGAVDPRVPTKYSMAAVPVTAVGSIAEYLPDWAYGLGAPLAAVAGTYVFSEHMMCLIPEWLPVIGQAAAECSPATWMALASAGAAGTVAVTAASAAAKVYRNDRLYVRTAAEGVVSGVRWVGGAVASVSAARSALQIVQAHNALMMAAPVAEGQFRNVLTAANREGLDPAIIAGFTGANTVERQLYETQAGLAAALPKNRQEAELDNALRRLVDFRVAQTKSLRAKVDALSQTKAAEQARQDAEKLRQIAALRSTPMASIAAPAPTAPAVVAQPPPPLPRYTPGNVAPPVRPGRARSTARPGASSAAASSAAASSAPAPSAAGGGGPALAASVVEINLNDLTNRTEFAHLAGLLPEQQGALLLVKIGKFKWTPGNKEASVEAIRAYIRTLGVVTQNMVERSVGKGGRRTRRNRRTMRNRR